MIDVGKYKNGQWDSNKNSDIKKKGSGNIYESADGEQKKKIKPAAFRYLKTHFQGTKWPRMFFYDIKWGKQKRDSKEYSRNKEKNAAKNDTEYI